MVSFSSWQPAATWIRSLAQRMHNVTRPQAPIASQAIVPTMQAQTKNQRCCQNLPTKTDKLCPTPKENKFLPIPKKNKLSLTTHSLALELPPNLAATVGHKRAFVTMANGLPGVLALEKAPASPEQRKDAGLEGHKHAIALASGRRVQAKPALEILPNLAGIAGHKSALATTASGPLGALAPARALANLMQRRVAVLEEHESVAVLASGHHVQAKPALELRPNLAVTAGHKSAPATTASGLLGALVLDRVFANPVTPRAARMYRTVLQEAR